MTTYTPAPGTVAFRVIGWLEEQGATKEFNASQIANALDLDPKTITTCLQNALDTGLVFRRQKDRSHPRAPFWYTLADARSKASRAVMEAIAIAPNSQRHESGAQHGGDAGNMARNTEHAAPLGGPAEGEGATAPSPGMREAKADEGAPCDGELMVSCGGTVIQLKAEHVQRLRRLLGGGA